MHLLCFSSCSSHPLQLNHIDNIHDEVLYSSSGFHVNFCHACPQGLCQVFLLFILMITSPSCSIINKLLCISPDLDVWSTAAKSVLDVPVWLMHDSSD